ncbi:hypothetical protein V8D89_011864 [Ganoderma adspersum]
MPSIRSSLPPNLPFPPFASLKTILSFQALSSPLQPPQCCARAHATTDTGPSARPLPARRPSSRRPPTKPSSPARARSDKWVATSRAIVWSRSLVGYLASNLLHAPRTRLAAAGVHTDRPACLIRSSPFFLAISSADLAFSALAFALSAVGTPACRGTLSPCTRALRPQPRHARARSPVQPQPLEDVLSLQAGHLSEEAIDEDPISPAAPNLLSVCGHNWGTRPVVRASQERSRLTAASPGLRAFLFYHWRDSSGRTRHLADVFPLVSCR